ncbi:hypothetical protein RCL_jg27197.t1 [Rhizophagus clarus]|uniref:Uncharacterized protein n=1 Tax=Rhizophagus clarus TaxID=94130 RepID=A0A8H3LWL2_9GLOM|nr:hypothetical protein RCL_jg27197.t1 [Rhizophagus clarus]
MDSKPHDVQPIIKTDHRILTLDLFIDEIFINKNNKQTRQLPSKVIYCYDEMQAIDGDWTWEKFNDHIENHLDDPCISLTVDKIRDEIQDILQNTVIMLESKYINAIYEYKKVSVDKVYKNDNNEDTFYTEENNVKEQTNFHFQTIAGAVNCEKDLSHFPEW